MACLMLTYNVYFITIKLVTNLIKTMQNLYVSIRYLLTGYIFCGIGWLVEDLIQPLCPSLSPYFEASYIACYILMMHFVTLSIFSLEKKSKTLRVAGWLIVLAIILAIWSIIPQKENQKELLYNIAGLFSFMSGYYIIVEYSKIIEKSALVKTKKVAHRIRQGIAFADMFFMVLLIPVILSAFPILTNTLVDVDLYIYYIVWILFVIFLILCIMEIKQELKPKKIEHSTQGGN